MDICYIHKSSIPGTDNKTRQIGIPFNVSSPLQRIMDSAEQAAMGDNDVQSSPAEGFYDAREINQYAPDGRPVSGSKELLMRTLRRFDRMPVNLTHSTILKTTSDTDLEGECTS